MRALFLAAAVAAFTLTAVAPALSATCTGSASCKACKNCSSCKHCAKQGGSCGVCSKPAPKTKSVKK